MSISFKITYQDKNIQPILLAADPINQLIFDKMFLSSYNIPDVPIMDIDIKTDLANFPVIIINNDFKAEHIGISSYMNTRSSIALLKLYNIKLIHINDLDINSINTYRTSPLIVRCNIKELYTGCEIHESVIEHKDIEIKEYAVDIRRESNISHFVADGKLSINVQESNIKDFNVFNFEKTQINRINIWNGSSINLLKISAPTNIFKVHESNIETLTLGDTCICSIELSNEIIHKSTLAKNSFKKSNENKKSISKWRLIRKSAIQNNDRNLYNKACYWINKSCTSQEKKYIKKVGLMIFSLICGYGYKPSRVLISSLVILFLFGITYLLIGTTNNNAFIENLSTFDYFYFSGVAFSTIGFGDIKPYLEVIKTLSVFEGMCGVGMLSLFMFSLTKKLTESMID